MPFDTHSLLGYSKVATVVSQNATTVVLTVEVDQGSLFAVNQQVTVWPANAMPLMSNAMVGRITAVSDDELTINIASVNREGSNVRTVTVGDQIANSITPKALTDIEDDLSTLSSSFSTHNHTLASLSEKSYLSLTNTPDLSSLHSHANKALLDTYDQTNANLADAVVKKHAHANQTALNAVTGVNTGDQDLSALQAHVANTSNPHSVTKAQVGLGNLTNDAQVIRTEMGTANGVATLGSDGKVPNSQLSALALTDVYVVASQAAQLALTAQEGDVAIRTDQNKTYAHNGGTAGTMADWNELLTPTDQVLSVDGRTGAVTLSDLYSSLSHTHDSRYYTETETDSLLSGYALTSHNHNSSYLQISNNLSDLGNVGTARTNLGLVAGGAGDIWVEKAGDTMTGALNFSISQPITTPINVFTVVNNSVNRTILYSTGRQSWYLADQVTGLEVGEIQYAHPNGQPGIVFYNNSGTGRAQIKQHTSFGGLSIASTTGNGNPGDKFIFDTNAQLGINASPTSRLTLGGTAVISTTSNANLSLVPNGTGYTIIGDAGTTSHSFNTNDDLLVSGKLEVDGEAFFDGNITGSTTSVLKALSIEAYGGNAGFKLTNTNDSSTAHGFFKVTYDGMQFGYSGSASDVYDSAMYIGRAFGGGDTLVATIGKTDITAVSELRNILDDGLGNMTIKGNFTIADAKNIVLNTTTGTKIGTATNQKLGFYNATPVVQQSGIADADGSLADITTKFNSLLTAMEAYGLLAVA